jgi:hypothetical protein
VKLAQFNQLCQSEWDNDRGVVAELWLSQDSFDELYTDIFVNRSGSVIIVHPHWDIINPITREAVKVKTCDSGDTMVVYYGRWKQRRSVKLDVSGT